VSPTVTGNATRRDTDPRYQGDEALRPSVDVASMLASASIRLSGNRDLRRRFLDFGILLFPFYFVLLNFFFGRRLR
jgi:hypothetical protein